MDTKNGIMLVNLKADFFKPRRSGGDNSALTSIPTKHGARDTSIQNDRGPWKILEKLDMASNI